MTIDALPRGAWERGNYPLIRFSEFMNDWNFNSFSSFCSLKKEKYNPLKSENKKCIELEHLSKSTGKILGFIDSRAQKSTKNIFNKGDVLFGKLRPNLKKYAIAPFDGVCSSEILVLNSDLIQNEFLFHLLSTERFYKASTISSGSKMPRADMEFISAYPFYYSNSKKEQQKIADFLSSVDKKISLLKEKQALLVQYKKGVMQKLFSQEIRFKDENGNDFPDWSNKVVGDFMVESRVKGNNGLTAKKITVKLWGKGVFQKNENILGSENTQYYQRKSGQFIYSKLDFLNCAFGLIPDSLNNFETTVDLPCFDVDSDINKYLILELIKQKCFYKKFGDMADGSRKAKRIHAKDFLSFPINLPCESEQNKIANFLQSIDKKLNLVSDQIDQTQTFKKGLLQQMFV